MGAARYIGKPCKYGHTERYAKGRGCVACNLEHNRAYRKKHPERVVAYSRKWQKANPLKMRKLRGLPEPTRPLPEFCELCGGADTKELCLDHDHETGKFRGWLCRKCNTAIARLGDNVDGLRRALAYLERSYEN